MEIWDTITEGLSTAWETITTLPDLFRDFISGGDVNFTGFAILTIFGWAIVIGSWFGSLYYFRDHENYWSIKLLFSWTNFIIAMVVSPIICYFFAWRAARQ